MTTLYSKSIDEAIKKYPVLKSTVNKSKKLGINIISHFCLLDYSGRVSQHNFKIKYWGGKVGTMSNEMLKGFMSSLVITPTNTKLIK